MSLSEELRFQKKCSTDEPFGQDGDFIKSLSQREDQDLFRGLFGERVQQRFWSFRQLHGLPSSKESSGAEAEKSIFVQIAWKVRNKQFEADSTRAFNTNLLEAVYLKYFRREKIFSYIFVYNFDKK